MTALSLDLRGPLLVVVGSFNPPIFSPSWIATNIFGIPEGAEMSFLEAMVQIDPQTVLRLAFINGVALSIMPNRMDLFVANGTSGALTAVEAALIKIFKVLPHTPVQAIGCNVRWQDSDPASEIIDLFDSSEGLEGKYKVEMRQVSTQIALDNAILNFSRVSLNNEVQFNFNYHRNLIDSSEIAAIVDGMITRDLAHSTTMMQSLYGYDQHSTLEYATEEQQGELAHVVETAD